MSGAEIAAAVIIGLIGLAGLAVAAYSAILLFARKLWSYNDRPAEDLYDDMLIAAASIPDTLPGNAYLGFAQGPVLRQRDYELIAEAANAAKKQDEEAKRLDRQHRKVRQPRSRSASEQEAGNAR